MISSSGLCERSILVMVSSMLVWATFVPHSLVIGSALSKTSPPVESKSENAIVAISPVENVSVDDGFATLVETLAQIISNSAQSRLSSQNLEPRNADSITANIGKEEETDGNLIPFNPLFADYFKPKYNRLSRRFGSTAKRAAAMGVDLPDYILHMNKGRNFDFSSFREKMQKSG